MNLQANELNSVIQKNNPIIFKLLSEKGKNIFFPKKGILAQSADAKNKKINATIGTAIEDDGTPMRLKSIQGLININPEEAFPYAPSYGKPELRKEWLVQIKKKNPSLETKTSLPIVTSALTHGLSITGYLFVNKGDEIITTDKFWGNYRLIFEHAYDAKISTFNTFKNNCFDVTALKNKLSERTGKKILLLNFPNNPAGYTPTDEEVEQIKEIILDRAKKKDELLVICDDAYFGLVYERGVYRESIFSKLADLHENILAVKIDGATKEDYVWGFRTGFITYANKILTQESYQALEAKTAGAIRGNISNASHLSQSLVLKALNSPTYKQEKEEKYQILKARYNKVVEVLKNKKYVECFKALPYNSGYFMCIELKNNNAEEVRETLLDKYDTGVISMQNTLRIAFSGVKEEFIEELFENIYNACKEV